MYLSLPSVFAGVTRTLLAHLVEHHEVVTSPQIIEEFRRVVIGKLYANPKVVEAFLDEFTKTAVMSLPPYPRFNVRDATDVEILGAALKAMADVLVTGDKDLLEFKDSPIPVMKPRALYDLLVGGT